MRKISVFLVFLIVLLLLSSLNLMVKANPDELIDSYSETNFDSSVNLKDLHPSDSAENSAEGQSFTPTDNYKLTYCQFYLRKAGTPTGNGHAVLYAHTGTFGTSSVPTGSALATSDDFDVSTLTTSNVLITFTFSGANQYSLVADTPYCIEFQNPTTGTINADNYVRVGRDGTTPTHAGNGNYYTNGGWVAHSTTDVCFYVYGTLEEEGTTVNFWGTTALTFSVNSIRSTSFTITRSATETMSVNGLKSVLFSTYGNAQITYGVSSLIQMLFGTVLNLFGTATFTLNATSERMWQFNIIGNAEVIYGVVSLTNIFVAGLLNLCGEAILTFTIIGLSTIPLEALDLAIVGVTFSLIALCLAIFAIIRKRKQEQKTL